MSALAQLHWPEPGHRSVARSHVGNIRQFNEDRVLDRPDRALWAVADGMGGHRGGDIAASIAVEALRRLADGAPAIDADAIRGALATANADIYRRGESAGMIGSTIVVLHIADNRAHLFWAGDSRAYCCSAGRWRQLTADHSLVQELLDAGAIDAGQAARHPQAHVITRALGADPEIALDQISVELEPGDVLLLCSDGLSRSLDLNRPALPVDEATADRLIAETLERDGTDNISFVLVAPEPRPMGDLR